MVEKQELSPQTLIKDILKVMRFGGTDPMSKSKFYSFIGNFFIFCSVLTGFAQGLKFIYVPHTTVDSIVKDFIVFSAYIQTPYKHFTAMKQKQTLSEMIKTSWIKFWTIDSLDEETKEEILEFYRKTKLLTTVYSIGIMSGVNSIVFKAIVRDHDLFSEVLFVDRKILLESPYYEIAVFLQVLYFNISIYIGVVQIDKLYIIMIGLVLVQFKLLKRNILLFGNSKSKIDNYKLLKNTIIHHNVVLKFVAGFEEVYSQMFLPTLASTFSALSISMWCFVSEEALPNRAMSIFVYIACICQMFAYCLAGQLIQDAGMSLRDAAYNCDWTNYHDYKLRMGIVFIILKATKKIEITVGGFMVLSMQNFAAICRASFTFMAFLINVKNK